MYIYGYMGMWLICQGCPCKYYLEHGTIKAEEMDQCVKEHGCNPEELPRSPLYVHIYKIGSRAFNFGSRPIPNA